MLRPMNEPETPPNAPTHLPRVPRHAKPALPASLVKDGWWLVEEPIRPCEVIGLAAARERRRRPAVLPGPERAS